MKTAIIVPVWKRPEITKVCFENLSKTGCQVIAAVSERWAEELANEYGFMSVRVKNDYLGRKKNKLLTYALEYEWDRVMEMGSDNLCDLSKLDEYLSVGLDHYGLSGMYFVNPNQKKAQYYLAPGRIWGAMRVISRKAVEASVPLWDDRGTIYLDSQANTALKDYPFACFRTPICVDIKSETNIHPYSRFTGKMVNYSRLKKAFPELRVL